MRGGLLARTNPPFALSLSKGGLRGMCFDKLSTNGCGCERLGTIA